MEFCFDRDPSKPAGEVVASALAKCRDEGVLALPAGAHGNIVRTLSPLVISDADLDHAIEVIEHSVLSAASEARQ
ncbi:MAG: hypothetical protein R2748_33575 [Bryobacterales bacterium]